MKKQVKRFIHNKHMQYAGLALALTFFALSLGTEQALLASYVYTIPCAVAGAVFLIFNVRNGWESRRANPGVWFLFAAAGGLLFYAAEEFMWAVNRFILYYYPDSVMPSFMERYFAAPVKFAAALFAFFHVVAAGYKRLGFTERDISPLMISTAIIMALLYPIIVAIL